MSSKQKIIIFDIESYHLEANRGWMVCMGWKEYGKKKIHMIGPDVKNTRKATMYKLNGEAYEGNQMVNYNPFNDRDILLRSYDVLADAGMLVHHFGDLHDIPFIQTRLLAQKLPVLPPQCSDDQWKIMRYGRMRMTRNTLAAISEFLGCTNKYWVNMDEWQRACIQGDADQMKRIMRHCVADVKMTEETWSHVRSLSKAQYMNMALDKPGACPKCGTEGSLEGRGYRHTKTGRAQRFFCKECRCWCQGPVHSQRGILR